MVLKCLVLIILGCNDQETWGFGVQCLGSDCVGVACTCDLPKHLRNMLMECRRDLILFWWGRSCVLASQVEFDIFGHGLHFCTPSASVLTALSCPKPKLAQKCIQFLKAHINLSLFYSGNMRKCLVLGRGRALVSATCENALVPETTRPCARRGTISRI